MSAPTVSAPELVRRYVDPNGTAVTVVVTNSRDGGPARVDVTAGDLRYTGPIGAVLPNVAALLAAVADVKEATQ